MQQSWVLAPFYASELGFWLLVLSLIYFFPLFELTGIFFSGNLLFCHLGEMGVVSNYCINIIYPVPSQRVLLYAVQGSSDTWFEGMDLVYCLANCNRGCCSPG